MVPDCPFDVDELTSAFCDDFLLCLVIVIAFASNEQSFDFFLSYNFV